MVTAEVKLWGEQVGAVLWDEAASNASFEYSPDFVAKGLELSPLLMPLPVRSRGQRIFTFPTINPETFHGLPGLLADSLPDKYGTTLIDAWLSQNGRSPGSVNPVERLCYIGKRGMGALEFEPALGNSADASTKLEIDGLVEMAKKILLNREDFATNIEPGTDKGLQDIIKVGTSAGGARAKAIIAFNPDTNEVRSGQVSAPEGFSHWLLKFDGIDSDILSTPQGYGRIEYAYYKMVLGCGIQMEESRLYEENGRAHFMTKRFDRIGSNEKLHVQTLCAMTHYDYKQPGLYSYEQAFQTMRDLRLSYDAAEQMYRRMVFNVMARNCDDHTKNISFIMDKAGQWSLAPAYDMSHAFNPGSLWVNAHNITLNGKRDNFNKEDLLLVAKNMNIKRPKEIIQNVCDVVTHWPDYAQDCGVKDQHINDLGKTHLIIRP